MSWEDKPTRPNWPWENEDEYSASNTSSRDSSSSGPSSSDPSSSDPSFSHPCSSHPSSSHPSSSDEGSSCFNYRYSFANRGDNTNGFVNEYEPSDKVNIESFYDSIYNENFMIYRDNIYNYLNIFKIINEEIINNMYSSINSIMLLKDIFILFLFSISIILGGYVLYLKINYLFYTKI